jgi:CHAT domain-containing protein
MLAWQLDADIVTLSACETGLGRNEAGEGYVGFSQALFLAGARTLVLSQWQVDDVATALLMQRFYQNLLGRRPGLADPLNKAAALAEAKQWLRCLSADEARRLTNELPTGDRGGVVQSTAPIEGVQPYAHPYFWAGFVLIGEPGDVRAAVPVLAEPVAVVRPGGRAATGLPDARHWPWIVGGLAGLTLLAGLIWRWRAARRRT